jgi:hypothetical protein
MFAVIQKWYVSSIDQAQDVRQERGPPGLRSTA